MPIKTFRPVTPSRRFMTVSSSEGLADLGPERSLTKPMKRTGGRNNRGRVTSRFRGGGAKRRYRIIDFRRDKRGIPARVAAIEYDPNRSARIALLHYVDGEKRYILAPDGLKLDARILAGPEADIAPGNALPLARIPLGMEIHNIEMRPGRGGQIVRSAGLSAQLMAREGQYAQVRLPSGEIRRLHLDCYATLGRVGNSDHEKVVLGKAGRKRWLGRRPHTRGVAMNPVDHPMGGGEGRSSGGGHPVSPWGQLSKGYKTRKKNKPSSKFIVKRRK